MINHQSFIIVQGPSSKRRFEEFSISLFVNLWLGEGLCTDRKWSRPLPMLLASSSVGDELCIC